MVRNKIQYKKKPDNPNQHFYFSGIRFDNVTFPEAMSKLEQMIDEKKKGYVVTSNAQHISVVHNDKSLKKIFNNASLLVADGMSIVWASKLLGNPLKERCSGPDLFIKLFKTFGPRGTRFFILGGIYGTEKVLKKKLLEKYHNLKINTYSPPFGFENNPEETSKIIRIINKFNTEILILCVGSPKSEKWISDHFPELDITLGFSLGAALNFYAGYEERAPKWIQNAGLEWFFRLSRQPRRLWKRYLLGNIIFSFVLVKEFLKPKAR